MRKGVKVICLLQLPSFDRAEGDRTRTALPGVSEAWKHASADVFLSMRQWNNRLV